MPGSRPRESGAAAPGRQLDPVTSVAVVGHIEWVRFAVVDHVPVPGEIIHAHEQFELAAGGGAVAAVQLQKLAGSASFFTAIGSDEYGAAADRQLRAQDVDVHAGMRPVPQRSAFTHLSADHERTITVVGERLVPHGDEPLDWEQLAGIDGVYFTGGDGAALRQARRARVLVASARAMDVLADAQVPLDALVASASDAGERYASGDLDPEPTYVVRTQGEHGGQWQAKEGHTGTWAAAPLPGPPVDAYGCGDAFAAGLTFALASGLEITKALALAARCGAATLSGRGPYTSQLTAGELNGR